MEAQTQTYNFKRVYVWELPVRIFHWTLAITIPVLIATGFVIADPPAISSAAEASNSYWFGYVRLIHFTAAFLLVGIFIIRIYWAFVGNRFASWRHFFPYTKKGLKNILYVLKVDVFLMKDKEKKLSNISIGHNYLAGFSYFIIFLLLVLQAFTGFALYADNSAWWFPKLVQSFAGIFGDDMTTRSIHHILAWIFMAFIVVHLYLVLYHDYVEARGETSAMISGYKFIRSERMSESEDEIIERTTRQMWRGEKPEKNKEKDDNS